MHLWTIVKVIESNWKATSIVSSSTPRQDAIDSWQDQDGCVHAFMLFNMKPQVAGQFLGKDDETAKEFWDAVQQRYHRANKARMIALGNQLTNLQVSNSPNIMDQITHFFLLQKQVVSLGSKDTEEEFAHCLIIKLP